MENVIFLKHENRKDWHWTHLWWRSLHEYKLRFSYNGNFHKSSLGRLVWHTSGWIVRCLLTLFGIRYESNMDDTYIVLPGKSYILAHPCSRCRYGIVGNKQAYAKSYEASKYNDKNWFKLMKKFIHSAINNRLYFTFPALQPWPSLQLHAAQYLFWIRKR